MSWVTHGPSGSALMPAAPAGQVDEHQDREAAQTARAELFSEHAILFVEIFDDVLLLLVHPAGERHEEELDDLGKRRHTERA